MYRDIAESWISRDQDLSDTQQHFLLRSAEINETIADRIGNAPELQHLSARALLNAGVSYRRLLQYPQAEDALKRAIMSMESIVSDENRRKLAEAWHQLGDLHVARRRFDDASDSFGRARRFYEDVAAYESDLGFIFRQHQLADAQYAIGVLNV